MSMTRSAADYFDRVAGDWDKIRSGYFTEAVRDAAVGRAYLRPEMVVADVGCGTGFVAAGLAPLVSKVYALDGSAAMLEQAQRNLAGHTNIEYHVSDGHTLPLPDAAVDAVFANMYLHHCPDPLAAVREMARILRSGGRLVITDMDRHDHAWMRAEMADEWLGFDRGQVKTWLREAALVNGWVGCSGESCCATLDGGACAEAAPVSSGEPVSISVFLAAAMRRVTGAREAVQANYAAVAVSNASCCTPAPVSDTFKADIELALGTPSSCCAPASDSASSEPCCAPANAMPLVLMAELALPQADTASVAYDTGYSAEQIAAVPAEAAAISLGCGNPTALASLRPGETVLDIGSGGGIDAFFASQRVGRPAG